MRVEANAWRWMLGLTVLMVMVWVGIRHLQRGESPRPGGRVALVQDEAAASTRFTRWVADSADAYRDPDRAGDYARAGLEQLADAIEELVGHGAAPHIVHDAQRLRQRARRLGEADADSDDQSRYSSDACVIAAGVLDEIRDSQPTQSDFADHAAAALQAADGIRPDAPVAGQRAELQEFFEHVAAALDAVDRARFRSHVAVN